MKHGVSRKALIFTAGLAWVIAGANILRIGINTWLYDSMSWPFKLVGAVLIFGIFFTFVFRRLFGKNILRITQKNDSNCPFAFFDAKGWIVMVAMITLGITVRHFHLLPNWFIAMFYTGLSSALILTGMLFLYRWKKE